jgi:hypothetical protein
MNGPEVSFQREGEYIVLGAGTGSGTPGAGQPPPDPENPPDPLEEKPTGTIRRVTGRILSACSVTGLGMGPDSALLMAIAAALAARRRPPRGS